MTNYYLFLRYNCYLIVKYTVLLLMQVQNLISCLKAYLQFLKKIRKKTLLDICKIRSCNLIKILVLTCNFYA